MWNNNHNELLSRKSFHGGKENTEDKVEGGKKKTKKTGRVKRGQKCPAVLQKGGVGYSEE